MTEAASMGGDTHTHHYDVKCQGIKLDEVQIKHWNFQDADVTSFPPELQWLLCPAICRREQQARQRRCPQVAIFLSWTPGTLPSFPMSLISHPWWILTLEKKSYLSTCVRCAPNIKSPWSTLNSIRWLSTRLHFKSSIFEEVRCCALCHIQMKYIHISFTRLTVSSHTFLC